MSVASLFAVGPVYDLKHDVCYIVHRKTDPDEEEAEDLPDMSYPVRSIDLNKYVHLRLPENKLVCDVKQLVPPGGRLQYIS